MATYRRHTYEEDNATFNADAYTVQGWRGVAWHVLGWQTEFVQNEYEDECPTCEGTGEREDEEDSETYCCDDCDGQGKVWRIDEEPEERRTGAVLAVMVGDDAVHVIDESDLTPIEREEYCGECGQIGCGHDGLDRDE